MKFASVALGLALALVAACGSTEGPSTSDGASGAGQRPATVAAAGSKVDPSCNTRTTASKREDIPQGSCVEGATCAFQTPAGRCTPGVRAAAVVPNEWSCTCDGTWKCAIVAGGFGTVPCPGYELSISRAACTKGDQCVVGGCGANEDCFTSIGCGPLQDGGGICTRSEGPGDDRCHQTCTTDTECPKGQDCKHVPYFGCYDFNGWPDGKGICCGPNEACN